jgi:hypothetical protein
MSSPLYLLRHSLRSIPSALYAPENRTQSVRIIKSQSEDHFSSCKDACIRIGMEDALESSEQLMYTELLELVLKADKVVTL